MLIIDDAPNEIPLFVANLEERIMLFQHIQVSMIIPIQAQFNKRLWQVFLHALYKPRLQNELYSS
jgi:hypothetical protein